MSDVGPARRTRRPVTVGFLLLWLIVIGIAGVAEYLSWRQYQHRAATAAENLCQLIEQNVSDLTAKSDLAILAVVHEAERQLAQGGIDSAAISAYIAWQFSLNSSFDSIRIADAEGTIVYGIGVVPGEKATVADRDYFIRARSDPAAGLLISPPVLGRISGKWVMVLARRINRPNGAFAGVAYAVFTLAHFEQMFAALNLGRHGMVSLRRPDLGMVARYPALAGPGTEIGNQTVSADFLGAIARAPGGGIYRAVTLTDGVKRVFAYRRGSVFPGYVIVGTAYEEIFSRWREEAIIVSGLTILFTLVSLFAARMIDGAMRALEGARRAEEQARRHSDLILASAGEGICGVDSSGRVSFINAAARRMLGWPDGEGEGIAFHPATHHHHPDGSPYPIEDCPMHRMLVGGGGETVRVEDEVYWRRDGESFPVEYTLTPLGGADGAGGVVNVFRDITDSVRAREKIEGLLSKLQAILHNTPIGIALIGLDRVIIDANDAFCGVYGRQGQDITGQSARMLYGDPAQYEDIGRRAYPLIHRGETFQDDVAMVRSDGTQVWVRLVAHQVDVRHPDLGVVWAAEDISERKLLELDLKRSNAELERFAYVASHDLRQPLRMISSYLGMITRRTAGHLADDEREFLDFAIDGAKRMDAMIVDLLEYSRIGQHDANMEPVSLDEVLARAIDNLKVAIADAGATVVSSHGLPSVLGCESELERLFQNLISNAIKFRVPERAPQVTVECEEMPREWVFAISDNGIGIAPEDYDRLFVVFQRLVSREQYEGTGIGLAACRKIVEHHGGRIWVESEAGKGSTFLIALPRPTNLG